MRKSNNIMTEYEQMVVLNQVESDRNKNNVGIGHMKIERQKINKKDSNLLGF